MCCSVLQRVAACCSVLQRVAACCSVLQFSSAHHLLRKVKMEKCICVNKNCENHMKQIVFHVFNMSRGYMYVCVCMCTRARVDVCVSV